MTQNLGPHKVPPSADAIRVAVLLSGHTHCQKAWVTDCDSSNVCDGCVGDAQVIDRELALPERNAALLLAQGTADCAKRIDRETACGLDALLEQIDELREALGRITQKP